MPNKWSVPITHRSGVTAADALDPAAVSSGIETGEYDQCRFDVFLNSGTVTYPVELQVLFWNSRLGKFVRGAKAQLTELPAAVVVDCRGAVIFCKVTALAGTNPNITIDFSLS
jgi:hypothetical protein